MTETTMGSRIRKRRKSLGITQEELAELVNSSVNHISSIETSKGNPSVPLLIKICDALQITPDYVLIGTEHTQNVSKDILNGLKICNKQVLEIIQIIINTSIFYEL